MRNLLLSFDDFKGNELISERDLQDYLGRYQDLRDEWKQKRQESTDITDDVVFEIELIRQIEINIDYILMLVKKYHDTHCENKEVLITIHKAIDVTNADTYKEYFLEFPVYCAILLIFDARDFNTDIIYPEDVLGIPNLDLSKRFFMEKSKISASNIYSKRRR
jgi:hypothetical protein